MKRWLALAAMAAGSPLWAAVNYYFTDDLSSINNGNWTTAGTAAAGNGGLAAADANGGSLISRIPIPDGTSEAEVRATIHLAVSGGYYTEFLQATADAQTGGAGAGTHFAFEMQSPTIGANGLCNASFVVLQGQAGVTTLLASFQHSCRDGMVMRMAVHGGTLLVWPDQNDFMEFTVPPGAGQPGIGVHGTPAGNAISLVQLGSISRTAPPGVNPQQIGASAFRNRVDIQWPAVAANPSGAGLAGYWITRDGLYFMRTASPVFQDRAVHPGEKHTYTIAAFDEHYNFAPPAPVTVSIPAAQAGTPPPNPSAKTR